MWRTETAALLAVVLCPAVWYLDTDVHFLGDQRVIGETVAHYQICSRLGSGGMGEVYLATDLKLERRVALKFLPASLTEDPEARQRLLREARAASKLNHPSILTIYAVEEDRGRDFIVMEYVDGLTLAESIRTQSPSLDILLGVALQIAEGLERAHRAGIVHRDLKPANIMIDSDGHAKIFDFGLAKLQGAAKLTEIGSTPGTAAYMSPEQSQGEPIDHRSDLFSFGVVLYEMIAGRLPWAGEHVAAIVYGLINEEPQPLARFRANVPDEIQRIVSKCLVKRPEERYQSASDLIADLRHARRESGPGRTVAAPKRKRMLAVLPFENLGPADDEYFADGMTEEIISRLAAVGDLGVISRTSAMQYKGTRKSIREIGGDLGVDYVLEGTVRWSRSAQGSSRVRITPQLIRVDQDTHLWSERYDRVIDDIFAIQSEIAEHVIGQLNLTLAEPERRVIDQKLTGNMEAYYAYLRGIDYARRPDYKQEDFRLSAEMFERAVSLDSGFAQAYAELSIAHSSLYFYGYERTPERLARAKAAADRALELGPDLPESHKAIGLYHYRGVGDWDKALAECQLAVELQPNSTELTLIIAGIRRRQGRFPEALATMKQAAEYDPRSARLAAETAVTCIVMRRYTDAETFLDRSIALAPDQVNAFSWKAILYIAGFGDLKRAREALQQIKQPDPVGSFTEWFLVLLLERDFAGLLGLVESLPSGPYEDQRAYWTKSLLLGEVYELMGNQEAARTHWETARHELSQAATTRAGDVRVLESLALVYASLGLREEAIRTVEDAIAILPIAKDALLGPALLETRCGVRIRLGEWEAAMDDIEYLLSTASWLSAPLLRLNPRFDALRESPRFQRLQTQEAKVI